MKTQMNEGLHHGCIKLSKYGLISTKKILKTIEVEVLKFLGSNTCFYCYNMETTRWPYQKSKGQKNSLL